MSIQIKDSLSQILKRIKDSIDSIDDETTTEQEIEQAPTFDELKKPGNSTVVKTQTQRDMTPIKVTNLHETEFPENATELTQIDKLQNSEKKEQEHTTDQSPKNIK